MKDVLGNGTVVIVVAFLVVAGVLAWAISPYLDQVTTAFEALR